MRVLIMTFGTRGDIQPYAALAGALSDAGHEVALVIPGGMENLVPPATSGTIRVASAGSELLRLMQDVMPEASGPRDALKAMGTMRDAMREQLDETRRAAEGFDADVVVYHPKCLAGPHIAEALGVPGVLSLPLPFYTPTAAHPVPFLGGGDPSARGGTGRPTRSRASPHSPTEA